MQQALREKILLMQLMNAEIVDSDVGEWLNAGVAPFGSESGVKPQHSKSISF